VQPAMRIRRMYCVRALAAVWLGVDMSNPEMSDGDAGRAARSVVEFSGPFVWPLTILREASHRRFAWGG
ncbi:MAG: hypothetical protein WD207_06555, partial [Xanthobacteraceae bacterium]